MKTVIGGVIVSVLSIALGRVFTPQSGQTKDYAIGICCFSAIISLRLICSHHNIEEKLLNWS